MGEILKWKFRFCLNTNEEFLKTVWVACKTERSYKHRDSPGSVLFPEKPKKWHCGVQSKKDTRAVEIWVLFRKTLIKYTNKSGEKNMSKVLEKWKKMPPGPAGWPLTMDGAQHLWPQGHTYRTYIQLLAHLDLQALESSSWCITGIFFCLSTESARATAEPSLERWGEPPELPRTLEEIWLCHKIFLQGRRIMAKCILIIAFMHFDLHR